MKRNPNLRRWTDISLMLVSLIFIGLTLISAAAGQDASLTARIELTKGGHSLKDASNAVVWLTPLGIARFTPPQQKPSEIPQLIQKNKMFHPSLLVIPVGGKVEFPNRDPFFHNVFSLFDGKRFDLGLYESGTTRFVQFDKPGVSYIFCNIHAQMSAVIVAVNTPYFAISDPRGQIQIANVPPGRYALQVFHPSVPPETLRTLNREITVSAGEISLGTIALAESDFNLEHKNKYGRDYDRPDPNNPAYAKP